MSAASAISTNASSVKKSPRSAFRFPHSPMRGRFASMCFLERISSKSIVSPGLHCRSRNLLYYFPSKALAQPVLQCFLENDGVAGDFHHITVEHRIVFPQKIRFIQTVTDHSDESAFGAHHTSQVDGPDFQALLAGAASRTARMAYHRTNEGIPSPIRGVLAVGDDLLFARRAFCAPRTAVGCAGGRWRIAFWNRRRWLRLCLAPGHECRNLFRPARLFRARRTRTHMG